MRSLPLILNDVGPCSMNYASARHMRDIVCTSRDGERFWKIPAAQWQIFQTLRLGKAFTNRF